jgi:hypothetical protein
LLTVFIFPPSCIGTVTVRGRAALSGLWRGGERGLGFPTTLKKMRNQQNKNKEII